jgi:SHS2 domain-containing protein
MFEVVEHTADVGLRIEASDWDTLLAEAARALFTLLVPNVVSAVGDEAFEFKLPPESPENLLVDWLTELLFAFESRRLVLCEFAVKADGTGLHAVARGERFDSDRHEIGYEIKAITYHQLRVEQRKQEWVAQVFLDL